MPESESNGILEPNSFDWCVQRLQLPGDPAFTAVARVACYEWWAWPEQLLGRFRAGEAVRELDAEPLLASGITLEPSRIGHVVLTRRVAWHLAYQFTGAPAGAIGEVFGGHREGTVAPFLKTAELLEELYPGPSQRIEAMKERVQMELTFE